MLDESITTCYSRTHNRKTAIELGHAVLTSKSIVILSVDKSIFEEAWQIFSEKFHDTALSFTDCTTYALIRAQSIQSVFSFDRDFDKLGVNRIPA
ncbi:MAG: PIN domain-containing protein [Thaumarchaeota archaeon]|nr:PIN domain-containing protein [Nitrososphaerota archaeon]